MKDKDGWIEWHVGEYPVPAGAFVDVRLRNGKQELRQDARFLAWYHTYEDDDIVAYRIAEPAEPAEPTAPDTSAEENRLWHEYAGKAMQGFLARDEIFVDMRADLDAFATGAADMADAMLTEARKRGRV